MATIGHFLIAVALMHTLGYSIPLANVTAFLIAFLISFSGHYFWTFQSTKRVLPTALRFFAVAIIAMGASMLLALILDSYAPWRDELKLALAVVVVPAVSFTISRLWIF